MQQNICRICAIETDGTDVIKLFDRGAQKLLRQIDLITGVFLEARSDLPEIICKICLKDLDCAIEFRRRCLRNHKRWQFSASPVSEPGSTSAPSATQVICVRRSARTSQRNAGKDEDMDEAPMSPVELLIKLENSNHPNDDDGIDHLESKTSSEISKKDDFSASENDAFEEPSKVRRRQRLCKSTGIKKPRIKQKLPVFFCDQCGNNVTGKSAFDRHLRKHNGIRPFQCEQCSARFLSAGELKGHQVMHTGDRKFPCRFCERAYVNYSGRLRHERTHTNERPFVCTQCGKGFTNSYILKNHMLVHTGERMFRCDLCDRAFSRPTHLKTHFRSNAHKQNAEKFSASQPQQQVIKAENSVSGIHVPQRIIELHHAAAAGIEVSPSSRLY